MIFLLTRFDKKVYNQLVSKIIKGELPSKTLYEDNIAKVIMSIDPLTNGHLLVIPKKHQVNILDIDEDQIYKEMKEKYKDDPDRYSNGLVVLFFCLGGFLSLFIALVICCLFDYL
jgi:hypothetical protein